MDAPPARKRAFRKNQPPPDAAERARLRALPQDTAEWDHERAKRMGASSSSCAVGLGPATPTDYWRLKSGRIKREDTELGLWIMARGHRVEPESAGMYERLMGVELYAVGICVHPTIAWIHASPDRLIKGCAAGIVELKCPVYTLPAANRPIPDQYMCQVQQQMQCVGPGVEWCDLCFYYRDDMGAGHPSGVRIWRIWRSEAYWRRMLWSMDRMATCLDSGTERAPTPDWIPLRPTMPRVRVSLVKDWAEGDAL